MQPCPGQAAAYGARLQRCLRQTVSRWEATILSELPVSQCTQLKSEPNNFRIEFCPDHEPSPDLLAPMRMRLRFRVRVRSQAQGQGQGQDQTPCWPVHAPRPSQSAPCCSRSDAPTPRPGRRQPPAAGRPGARTSGRRRRSGPHPATQRTLHRQGAMSEYTLGEHARHMAVWQQVPDMRTNPTVRLCELRCGPLHGI